MDDDGDQEDQHDEEIPRLRWSFYMFSWMEVEVERKNKKKINLMIVPIEGFYGDRV